MTITSHLQLVGDLYDPALPVQQVFPDYLTPFVLHETLTKSLQTMVCYTARQLV